MSTLEQQEPFDPSAYKHPHGPNETCDVCSLLGVISQLEARASEYRRRAEVAEAETQTEYERRIRERDEHNDAMRAAHSADGGQ